MTTLNNFYFTTLKIGASSNMNKQIINFTIIWFWQWIEIGLHILLTTKSIILSTIKMKNRTLLSVTITKLSYSFQQMNEWNKTISLNSITIQIVRFSTSHLTHNSSHLLDVEITVTLFENRLENNRCIIIASATSVTWNSSKNKTLLRLAIFRAISGRGSLRAPMNESNDRIQPYFCRSWWSFILISNMKEWKSTRAFLISCDWILLKRRSIR